MYGGIKAKSACVNPPQMAEKSVMNCHLGKVVKIQMLWPSPRAGVPQTLLCQVKSRNFRDSKKRILEVHVDEDNTCESWLFVED